MFFASLAWLKNDRNTFSSNIIAQWSYPWWILCEIANLSKFVILKHFGLDGLHKETAAFLFTIYILKKFVF